MNSHGINIKPVSTFLFCFAIPAALDIPSPSYWVFYRQLSWDNFVILRNPFLTSPCSSLLSVQHSRSASGYYPVQGLCDSPCPKYTQPPPRALTYISLREAVYTGAAKSKGTLVGLPEWNMPLIAPLFPPIHSTLTQPHSSRWLCQLMNKGPCPPHPEQA